LRHNEHAHLLSNIEKLPLPILGSMFPFWNPTGVFLQSAAHVEKDSLSLFVASLQSTSFVVSHAEGEGAPGSSGPVHSGHAAQHGSEDVTARSVSRCVRCSQTIDLQASCRRYTRTCNDFAKASARVDEMSLLCLLVDSDHRV
jgi:hypothetical protein